MTVLAAASWGGETWIASDRQWTAGSTIAPTANKLVSHGDTTWGFTGSLRQFQLISRMLKGNPLNVRRGADMEALADRVVGVLKKNGWKAEGADEVPFNKGLGMLVAYKSGRLFTLDGDMCWSECKAIAAKGSGGLVAESALRALKAWGATPREALVESIKIACDLDIYCSGRPNLVQVR